RTVDEGEGAGAAGRLERPRAVRRQVTVANDRRRGRGRGRRAPERGPGRGDECQRREQADPGARARETTTRRNRVHWLSPSVPTDARLPNGTARPNIRK